MRQALQLCRVPLGRKRNDNTFLGKQVLHRHNGRSEIAVGGNMECRVMSCKLSQ